MPSSPFDRRSIWHLLGFIGVAMLAAAVGLALLFADYQFEQDAAKLLRHDLGIAFLVAALVAVFFHLSMEWVVIGWPLRDLRDDLRGTAAELVRRHGLLVDTDREGIIAIHRRDERFKKAVLAAIENESELIYTMGRSHARMLIDVGRPGWLLRKLIDQSKRAKDVRVILADTFSRESVLRKQVKARGDEEPLALRARTTAKGLLAAANDAKVADRIALRLLLSAPPYGALVTSRRLFVEHYLPYKMGGASVIFEIAPLGGTEVVPVAGDDVECLYQAYRADFIQLFEEACPAEHVFRQYVDRKRAEPTLSVEDKDRVDKAEALIAVARLGEENVKRKSGVRKAVRPAAQTQDPPS